MDLTVIVQIVIGVVLVPIGGAVITTLIVMARMKQVIYGNGRRGLAGDVASNRRHIDDMEKKCLVAHGDGSSNSNGDSDDIKQLTKVLKHAVQVWDREMRLARITQEPGEPG